MVAQTVGGGDFAQAAPELANHVEERLGDRQICFLATVRRDGWPRVHPVGLNFRGDRLVVVMDPGSPKGRDLAENGRFAVHGTVEDNQGGKGEVLVTGTAKVTDPTDNDVERGWVAFELLVGEVLAIGNEPETAGRAITRWRAS